MDYQDGFEDGVKFTREVCSVARATHLIKLLDGELAFCGHHYNKNKEALDKKAYEIIQLNMVEEAVPQLEKAE